MFRCGIPWSTIENTTMISVYFGIPQQEAIHERQEKQ